MRAVTSLRSVSRARAITLRWSAAVAIALSACGPSQQSTQHIGNEREIAAQGPKESDRGITITVSKDGRRIAQGEAVAGWVDIRVTIGDGLGEHDQHYINFRPLLPPAATHDPESHTLTENPQVRTLRLDTRTLYDGENLFSVHVHPHHHIGHAMPFPTEFRVGQFVLLTENDRPAPGGDRHLPQVRGIRYPTPPIPQPFSATMAVDLDDDGGAIDIDAGGQVVVHLGGSVLGRRSWPGARRPRASGHVVHNAQLIPFMGSTAKRARAVIFFSDSVGRANYAFADIDIPAATAELRQRYPLPSMDAEIVNLVLGDSRTKLDQGGSFEVPEDGSFVVEVDVWHAPNPPPPDLALSTWIGSQVVATTRLGRFIQDLPPGSDHFRVPVQIEARRLREIEAKRGPGLDATALAIWNDFPQNVTIGHGQPVSSHVHLASLRTTAHGAPRIVEKATAEPKVLSPDGSTTLSVKALDDGQPGALSYRWSKLAGPGRVTFSDDSARARVAATFSAPGVYDLSVEVRDGDPAHTQTQRVSVLVKQAHPEGLVGHWSLDDSAWRDSSGWGNHLVAEQVPPLLDEGQLGGSAVFDFRRELRVPQQTQRQLDITGSMTVAAWIKPTAGGNQMIATKLSYKIYEQAFALDAGGGQPGFVISHNGFDTFGVGASADLCPGVALQTPIDRRTSRHPSAVPQNQWSHVAATFQADKGELRIYIDGKLAGCNRNPEVDRIFDAQLPFTIGAFFLRKPAYHFDGNIDDVWLFERALGGTEIAELMRGRAPQAAAGGETTRPPAPTPPAAVPRPAAAEPDQCRSLASLRERIQCVFQRSIRGFSVR